VSDRVVVTSSPDETTALGRRLAAALRPGHVVLLHGDLGAGKTTLAQGIVGALRPGAPATSPTFTIANEYPPDEPGQARLVHLDLYRLVGPDDLDSIGFDDLVAGGDAVVLVEWPERLGDDVPADYLLVTIEPAGAGQRQVELRPVPAGGVHAPLAAAASGQG
jgi:tRNA threonylcarbamoyl adenosine modification protein YjeE